MRFEICDGFKFVLKAIGLVSFLLFPSFAAAQGAAGKEWVQSGFGSAKKYRCKAESCGGSSSVVSSLRFGGISGAPAIGIPEGSNLEGEFRRRPEVRRILAAALKQYMKENGSKGVSISTKYYSNNEFVGFIFTGFDPKFQLHVYGDMRINGSRAVLIGSESENNALARKNFNAISPLIK